MMRNVAIGAVLGFGLVVLLLSIFNNEAPPQAPAPVAAADGDGGAPALIPLNVAPVIVVPTLKDPPAAMPELPPQKPAANNDSHSDGVLRGKIDEFQQQTGMLDTRDGGAR